MIKSLVRTLSVTLVTGVIVTVGGSAAQAATTTAPVSARAHLAGARHTGVRLAVTQGRRYRVTLSVPQSAAKHAKVQLKVRKTSRTARLNNKGAAHLSTTTIATTSQLPVQVTLPAGLARPVLVTATPLPGPTASTPTVSATIPSSTTAAAQSSATSVAPAAAATSTAAAAQAGDPSALATFARSSVTWTSGVTPGAISDSSAKAFASYRGRANGVISAFPERANWDQIRTGTWVIGQYAGDNTRLSLGVPLLPDNHDGTLADVAAGKHDADFLGFAHNLVAAGRGDSDIRLGWEFNGDWMAWSATNAGDFVAAYRHVAGLLRSVSPSFRLIWNGNISTSQCGHDPFTELYPGDDVVDGIGVDVYDVSWWAVTDAASFQHLVTMDHGLGAWAAFAAAHHKGFSVPEWGLNGVGTQQPGDQPAFIQGMHDWFASLGSELDYEAYYDDPNDYQRSSLVTAGMNQASSALYATLWAAHS